MDLYTFKPIYKTVIWGGDKIADFKGTTTSMSHVGESWEISSVPSSESVVSEGSVDAGLTINQLVDKYGARLLGTRVYREGDNTFPLLVKFIDAQRDLSVQVHPDDKFAREHHNSPGKTEMWYILDCMPGARIHSGLSAPLTPRGFSRSIQDDSIMRYVASYESTPGQFYFVPAGTIHSIGAGNLVLEIQQTSDITYRVYDYNRVDADGHPRQLHTSLAREAIDYTFPKIITPTAQVVNETRRDVVTSDYFNVDFLKLDSSAVGHAVSHGGESFRILVVTDGTLTVFYGDSCRTYGRGTTVLIPADIRDFEVRGSGSALMVGC